MRKKKFIFIMIFTIFLFCSVSLAECQHEFSIIQVDNSGLHYRICTLCSYRESENLHEKENVWSFDDEGKYHFHKCKVSGCTFEYDKGEHIGGSHDNNGICDICDGIYQTHELDVSNIKVNSSYHWYTCSYDGCDYVYDKELHEETEYVNGDLTHHWYRCKTLDCTYRFDEEKHYGGNDNDGYCEFELCKRLYMAKLQIDEYQYREYKVGEKDKLIATIIPEGIEVPKAEYKWESSMPEVVSIDKEGNIEALREGVSIIYATYGQFKASCVIAVGELKFTINPTSHTIYVNEIGASTIDVTYKKNNKDININDYVDFLAFRWNKNSLNADILSIKDNQVNFIGIDETKDPVIFNVWLNNRLKIIEEKLEKDIKVDEQYDKKELLEFKKEVRINVKVAPGQSPVQTPGQSPIQTPGQSPIQTPGQSPTQTPGQSPVQTPGQSPTQTPGQSPTQTPGQSPTQTPGQSPTQTPGQSPTQTPGQSPTQTPGQSPTQTPGQSPSQSPSVEGPPHKPEAPVSGSNSQNVVNRKHVCSSQGYFPNPDSPEKGHLRRCYYPECEYYKKGIIGTEAEHRYKYNEDKDVEMCIICYYEKGSGMTEPEIVHSRDFGIDVLQSQYLVVKDITTEIDVIITGVEKDLKIYYGPINGELKSTEGRDDENSVYLRWDIKDEYAREALEVDFKKRGDERIITVDLKDGYIQPVRTEVDLILENKFKEKRIETIELIKEAPERAQFILRFSSDVISAIEVGKTKEIKVICKSQYGYEEGDRKEVKDYYESKNLVKYEDIELKWEGSGGITVTGESTPNSEGYAKGQITGVSVTKKESPAVIKITATAKYENEDLIDEVERELERGIIVYEVTESNSNSTPSSGGNVGGGGSGNSGNALPIAAGIIGFVAIGAVAFVVNNITKG